MTEKKFDNEMRGSLWLDADRKNEKAPTASGTVTISGVDLRIAMWPKRVATVNGAERTYWPVSVEYRQGTKFVLAKISPADISVAAASAPAAAPAPSAPAPASDPDDIPF